MESFVPKKEHLREVLLHYYLLKKNAAESHRILVDVYGIHAPAEATCREWFRRFKSGDFDVSNKERPGQPKKFKDKELEALLNQNSCRTQEELALLLGVDQATISRRLKRLGLIQKQGNWVPCEMKPINVEDDIQS